MQAHHKNILRKLHVDFINDLDDINRITDYLFVKNILTSDHTDSLTSNSLTCREKTRKLMSLIVRRGPHAYDEFKAALSASNYVHLVELMNNAEKENTNTTSRYSPYPINVGDIKLPDLDSLQKSKSFIEPYPIKSTPRGCVLIINIFKYSKESTVKDRPGSEIDAKSLKEAFLKFDYDVQLLDNLKSEEFIPTVKSYLKSEKFNTYDAAGMVIMSHGLEKYVYAADGQLVSIGSIIKCFSNNECPKLYTKPKFLIFQACRGEISNHDTAKYSLNASDFIHSTEFTVTSDQKMPYLSDCVFAYSTLPGFVSYRESDKGSIFIQTFVDVMLKNGKQMHLMDLLAEVNRILVEKTADQPFKQISQPATTLTRPFYL